MTCISQNVYVIFNEKECTQVSLRRKKENFCVPFNSFTQSVTFSHNCKLQEN